MARLIFDSGPLVAVDNGDRRSRAWLEEAVATGRQPVVPTVVIAEVWRGGSGSARVARALRKFFEVVSLTEILARDAGELLARHRTFVATREKSLVIDAIVVVTAAQHGGTILTSDPDIGTLASGYSTIEVERI